MLMCKVCNRTIANAGNPKILYSTCIDCGKKYEKEERLLGQVPNLVSDDDFDEDGNLDKERIKEISQYINPGESIMEKMARKGKVDIIYPKGYDEELSELESLENSNPDDGSWKGR